MLTEMMTSYDPHGPHVKVTNYYAPWCGHSRQLLPTWGEVEKEYLKHSRVQIDKIDCAKNPSVAKNEQIRGFPTIILVKDGEKKMYMGDRSLKDIKKFIESNL